MTEQQRQWDASYTESRPPWDIGQPQAEFQRLADAGLLSGKVLDAGCGTGEHTILAASQGADAVGVDISPHAIGQARAKAAGRGLAVRFETGDTLNLAEFGLTFDTVIDSGMFHVFSDPDRTRYVTSLASVVRPGGHCYLMCFSDREPGDWGPRRVRQEELVAAFSGGWEIEEIAGAEFRINPYLELSSTQAWLATIRRT